MLFKDSLTLELQPDTFAVARLAPDMPLPAWAETGSFVSITRTQEELSIVCQEMLVPEGETAQRGFRCFKVLGPLDFALTGILASLAVPLAQAAISIFAVSTYDTDYLLLPQIKLVEAMHALKHAGHTVLG